MSFTELSEIRDYRDYAIHCDKERYGQFTLEMLKRGVRLIGRGIWYISAAHSDEQIAQTLMAVEDSLRAMH
ncbi:MAG: hypothetical protein R2873_23350 [Caldilineaceae bacterium]